MPYTPVQAEHLVRAIDAAYEALPDAPRPHLGASVMGKECMRAVWYGFRWGVTKKFSGRMLRLFERGRDEEEKIVRLLRRIGAVVHQVDAKTGKQYSFKRHAGHMGGSMDGAITSLPGFALSDWFLAEFKTSKASSFATLAGRRDKKKNKHNDRVGGKGVRIANPEHYSQMQLYMLWSGLRRALYIAINKDNDDLYTEVIEFDEEYAKAKEARGEALIYAEDAPIKLGQDASHFKCKMCDFSKLCHGKQFAEPNCRTCAHATPEKDGDARWSCNLVNGAIAEIPLELQRTGCEHHVYNPAFMLNHGDYKGGDSELNYAEYQNKDGVVFRNGTRRDSPVVYTSRELPFVPFGSPHLDDARTAFSGTYVAPSVVTEADVRIAEASAAYYNESRRNKKVKA